MNDIFAIQDKVTQSVVSVLAVHLTAEEQVAQRKIQTDSADAYEAFLRGRAHLELRRWEDFAKAISNFEKALELDPNYSRVYGALAEVYWAVWDNAFAELGMSQEESWSKMEHYLAEAMKSPNPTAQAQLIRSRYLTKQGRFEEAVAAAEQTIALDPNDADGYRALGRAANKAGRAAQGLDAMTKVRWLNPRGDDAGNYAYRIGESLFLLGRYEKAEAEFQKYRKRSGDEYWIYLMLAGVYGQLGRSEEAKAALDKFNEARAKKGKSPHTLATFDEWAFVPSVRKRYVESLRMAGMPPGD
jgi:tetratricopeptide (TPR) repeat protein